VYPVENPQKDKQLSKEKGGREGEFVVVVFGWEEYGGGEKSC
jgi:hypothetical protein